MNKIREEFEKDYILPEEVEYKNGKYQYVSVFNKKVLGVPKNINKLFDVYKTGYKSRDEGIKNLLKIKKVNEKSMAWTVKYNYNLIAIVEEIIDLVDVDYLEPDFRQRAKNVLLGRGLASIYRDEEIKKLRDALEWIIDEAQRQREGEGGDLRTIKHFAEQALKDGE